MNCALNMFYQEIEWHSRNTQDDLQIYITMSEIKNENLVHSRTANVNVLMLVGS